MLLLLLLLLPDAEIGGLLGGMDDDEGSEDMARRAIGRRASRLFASEARLVASIAPFRPNVRPLMVLCKVVGSRRL